MMNIDTIRRLHQQAAFQAGCIDGRRSRRQMDELRTLSERLLWEQVATLQVFSSKRHVNISQTHGSALEELESEYKKHGIRIITEG